MSELAARHQAKQRQAFELVRGHQVAEREAFKSMPGHLQDIARFQGLLNKPIVTEAESQRWPESHCDLLIAHYSPGVRRYVW